MNESKPIRILYMEDDSGLARLFQKTLERNGAFFVEIAPNGKAGLDMYDNGSYDMIFVDHKMPQMEGIDVIRMFAARGPMPPIVMVTGTGNEETAVEAMKLGASDYLVKDLDGGYLKLIPTLIYDVLQKRSLQKEKEDTLKALGERERQYREIFHQLRSVLEGTAAATGDQFFHSLVQNLAAALQVRYALVGELIWDVEYKLHTLALWWDGKFMENMFYPLSGTPCEKVLDGEAKYFPHNVQELFPTDHHLVEMGAKCYMGVPINGPKGKPLGVLAVLNSEPVIRAPNAQEILKIFAARAEGEIGRKRAAENLLQSELHLRSILNSAMDAIITITEDGIIHSFNPAAERIFGRNAALTIGQNVNILMPQPHKAGHDNYIRDYLRTKQGKIIGKGSIELDGLKTDGSTFPLDLMVSEMFLGEKHYFVGIIRDISVRKQAENELQLYREGLEKLVAKRTSELKLAHEQLMHAEKLSATGKLAASIAHEFNNPIYGIRNVLEQIGELKNLDERSKSLTSLAVRECNRVTDLIKKLQDFHRPSPGIIAPINVHTALDDMIMLLGKKMNERKITIEKNYAPDMPSINAVADQLRQVFLNIIQNAEEAIPDTGGKIVVATQVADNNIVIRIQDSGNGIEPEIMSLIFEPFFTTKSAVKGTGLGLSVSYGIVKRHGGTINVLSKPGDGATFIISLPLSGAQ